MTFKMSELVISTAKKNGDLPKEQEKFHLFPVWTNDYKFTTLGDAIKNSDVIKNYNEQFKKEFGVPSIFDRETKNIK